MIDLGDISITMERIQRLLSGGLGGGMGAPNPDDPVVDTAETVHLSSLALLKMLKHGILPLFQYHTFVINVIHHSLIYITITSYLDSSPGNSGTRHQCATYSYKLMILDIIIYPIYFTFDTSPRPTIHLTTNVGGNSLHSQPESHHPRYPIHPYTPNNIHTTYTIATIAVHSALLITY